MKVFVLGGLQDSRHEGAEADLLWRSCRAAGEAIVGAGHELLACSPFPDSADWAVMAGAENAPGAKITVHFPDHQEVRDALASTVTSLSRVRVTQIPHAPPERESREGWRNAWLLAQLFALEECDAVVVMGGRVDGAATLLLQVAEGKQIPVLPFAFLGGAGQQYYDRHQYTLADAMGAEYLTMLSDATQVSRIPAMLNSLLLGAGKRNAPSAKQSQDRFFISYPRARPSEADFVEMELRRRGCTVLRDEHDFGAGHEVVREIRQSIIRSTVFVALWSAEYACSPHCFDEMELAFDRHDDGLIDIWILLTDETRLVPPRARSMLAFPAKSREALHGSLMTLLERLRPG